MGLGLMIEVREAVVLEAGMAIESLIQEVELFRGRCNGPGILVITVWGTEN
jgi:hypothetical protein